jgi:putative phage-type endonuclease
LLIYILQTLAMSYTTTRHIATHTNTEIQRQLCNDIESITDDYIENHIHNCPPDLDELTEYTVNILHSIQLYKSDYIYAEYIRQLVAEHLICWYGNRYYWFRDDNHHHKVKKLLDIPQPAQRSEEWHALRLNSVGASESSAIFDANPYESYNGLVIKKCGHQVPFFAKYAQHGVMFEPVVQELYGLRNKCELLEFGSLTHPQYPFISASPDGITQNGVMVEIKVPPKREIVGIPPRYYWYQMQQQMQVCDLYHVDFIECQFSEYDTWNDFVSEFAGDGNSGLLLEYFTIDCDTPRYKYAPVNLKTINDVDKWRNQMLDEIEEKATMVEMHTFRYWKLATYSHCVVWRDDDWWNANKKQYELFWEKVLFHRQNGYEELIPKKRIYTKRDKTESNSKSASGFVFRDDD